MIQWCRCSIQLYIETCDVPTPKSLEEVTDTESFKKLASDDKTSKSFSNFALLLPYLVPAFLAKSSRKPSYLACAAIAAAENFKMNHNGIPNFDEKVHKEALYYILSFL